MAAAVNVRRWTMLRILRSGWGNASRYDAHASCASAAPGRTAPGRPAPAVGDPVRRCVNRPASGRTPTGEVASIESALERAPVEESALERAQGEEAGWHCESVSGERRGADMHYFGEVQRQFDSRGVELTELAYPPRAYIPYRSEEHTS